MNANIMKTQMKHEDLKGQNHFSAIYYLFNASSFKNFFRMPTLLRQLFFIK